MFKLFLNYYYVNFKDILPRNDFNFAIYFQNMENRSCSIDIWHVNLLLTFQQVLKSILNDHYMKQTLY